MPTGVTNVRIVEASGDELTAHFAKESFDLVISIEVYEHLHPEDGDRHLREVRAVLKPGGAYIVVTPNRLNGPADVTRDVYPEASESVSAGSVRSCHWPGKSQDSPISGIRRAFVSGRKDSTPNSNGLEPVACHAPSWESCSALVSRTQDSADRNAGDAANPVAE